MTDCGRGIFSLCVTFCLCFAAEDMDQYLHYVGGPVGALALTCVAAGSAYYLASRPVPEKPLVPLHQQSFLLPVSLQQLLLYLFVEWYSINKSYLCYKL